MPELPAGFLAVQGHCKHTGDHTAGTALTQTVYKSTATVVLPAAGNGVLRADAIRRWLSRADLSVTHEPEGTLSRLTTALGQPPVTDGLGALRLWGQTGDRPAVWMAAADPVYLEARLDHLCLHRLSAQELPSRELGEVFDALQAEFGAEESLAFLQLAQCGYLRGSDAIPTASLSAHCLHGLEPSPYMPTGKDAAPYHRLHSEIQMALHLSAVHRRREQAGQRPINALWIWGGGVSPERQPRALPPLFADDPLLRGYWHSAAGTIGSFDGDLADCIDRAPDGFVAVVPHTLRPSSDALDSLSAHLDTLRKLLDGGHLQTLKLLFRDGITATVRKHHRLRIWRRRWAPLESAEVRAP